MKTLYKPEQQAKLLHLQVDTELLLQQMLYLKQEHLAKTEQFLITNETIELNRCSKKVLTSTF